MGVKGFAAWLASEYPEAFAYGEPPPPPFRAASSSTAGAPPSAFAARRPPGWGGFSGGAAAAAQRASGAGRQSPATPPARFDHVYVDLAGLLHTALRQGEEVKCDVFCLGAATR
jgi:hypothetical protein